MSEALFTGNDRINAYQDYVEMARNNRHKWFRFHLDGWDPGNYTFSDGSVRPYMRNMYPSDVGLIVGQTSSGKSVLARQLAHTLERELPDDRPEACVVYVDTEVTTESDTSELFDMNGLPLESVVEGGADTTDLYRQVIRKESTSRILRISSSVTMGVDVDELTFTRIRDEIVGAGSRYAIQYEPAVIVIDYLQSMAYDESLRVPDPQFHHIINRQMSAIRTLGREFVCPIILAVQAKQQLTNQYHSQLPLPGLYDTQGSSGIIQKCQFALSIARPAQHFPLGTVCQSPGHFMYTVKDDLVYVRVLKQQGGSPAGRIWPLRHNFKRGIFTYDKHYADTFGVGDRRNSSAPF